MKIALLAPFEEPIPPEKYGGTELVVANLAEGLVAAGHEVYAVATGDSKTSARLLSTFPRAIRKESIAADMNTRSALKFMGVARTLELIAPLELDIIHNHIGWRFIPFAKQLKAPVITTLHGPLDINYQKPIYLGYPGHPYVSISDAQRRPLPDLQYAATVYNGIDITKFQFNDRPGSYLAFLGRMSPEKGPKIAIEVARQAGMKLKMAAKIDAVDRAYFTQEIQPLIDGKQIEYIGEIGPEEKSDFLRQAAALLAPIQWEEPFGLFLVEALACGTPVIALRRGSVPELIRDGETGFVVTTPTEMVERVSLLSTIDRQRCRQDAEERFTIEAMTQGYAAAYQQVVQQR